MKFYPQIRKLFFFAALAALFVHSVPLASAHEMYVLGRGDVAAATAHTSPNPLALIAQDGYRFTFWACLVGVLIAAIFFISISRRLERRFDPLLLKLKRYAPLIARLTLGVSLIASANYNALFGPELPLPELFGQYAALIRPLLFTIGICVALGLFVRISATIALVVYAIALWSADVYMLTYLNYLGEILFVLILGGGGWSLDGVLFKKRVLRTLAKFERYSFAINRICFGVAVLFASVYSKLFHANLALETVNQYRLTDYFHFSPLFVVLGALLVESLIGIFIILGFEIRFASLVFLVFLALSLSFFGEVVWPHLILIGLNLAMIAHGYDKYSLEGRFFKRGNREPVL